MYFKVLKSISSSSVLFKMQFNHEMTFKCSELDEYFSVGTNVGDIQVGKLDQVKS
jgi:hypothetical protein